MRSPSLLTICSGLLFCCHTNDPATIPPAKSASPEKTPCPELSWVESAPLSPALPDRSRELVRGPKAPPTAELLARGKILMEHARSFSDGCLEDGTAFYAKEAYEISGDAEALFLMAACDKFRNPARSYVAFALYAERVGATIAPTRAKLMEEYLAIAEKRSLALDIVCEEPGFEIELDDTGLGVSPIAGRWRANSDRIVQSKVTTTRGECSRTTKLTFTNALSAAIVCRRTSQPPSRVHLRRDDRAR